MSDMVHFEEYTRMTRPQLEERVAQGDHPAQVEIERRESKRKGAKEGTRPMPLASMERILSELAEVKELLLRLTEKVDKLQARREPPEL
jgi:hypothetical protein